MPKLRDDVNNVDILNAVRADARRDYQEMVPEATKGNIKDTIAGIMQDDISRNEFLRALVNRIGSTLVRDITWKNPLAVFKQGMLNFGDTIEEVHVDLIKPTVYNEDRDYLEGDIFGQARPPVYSAFHKINRKDKFKITVNHDVIRRAFLSDSGLAEMLSAIMAVPASSDEWVEFMTVCSLFREYESKWGFHRVKIPDMNALVADKNSTDSALKALRIMADKMRYPTPAYNKYGVHSFARPEDLVIITTPEFKANIDVTSLAAAFNRVDAEAPSHIITIPNESLQLEDTSAILTTKDFLLIKDVLLENRSISNPEGLYDNFFLHHWSILSVSAMVPAVAFGTKENTTIVVPPEETNSEIDTITLRNKNGDSSSVFKPGSVAQAEIVWKKKPAGAGYATDWYVKNTKHKGTEIDNDGLLTIDNDEPEGNIKVGVKVWTKDVNGNKPVSKEIDVQIQK